MFERMSDTKREFWAPLIPALEQIADAIAAASLEAQLEHRLPDTPDLRREFDPLFQQRHPAAFAAYEAAWQARNQASWAAAREKAKLLGIAKRKATLARKKAAPEAKQQATQ